MLQLISQDIKAIARRTLGEIFPRGDLAALAEVVHPNLVDHDGPPGAPQGLRRHGLVHAHAPSGVLGPALGAPPGHRRRRHRGPLLHLPWPPHRGVHGPGPDQPVLRLPPDPHPPLPGRPGASSTGPSLTTWTWPASSVRSPARPANPFLRMPWPSCCRTCTRNVPLELRGRARQQGSHDAGSSQIYPRGAKRRLSRLARCSVRNWR